MKKFTLIALIALSISACKKSSTTPAVVGAELKVQVSGLTELTSLNIKVVDVTQYDADLLDLVDQYGNKIYSTTQNVNPGDNLRITISADIDENGEGDGEGTIIFLYNGVQIGSHTGAINIAGFTLNETVPQQ